MTLDMTNLTAALQDRIDALTGTEQYKDLLLLAKAIEAMAGRASVSDVMIAGSEQIVAIDLHGADQLDAIDLRGTEQVDAITAAAAAKVAEIGSLDAVAKTGGTMSGLLNAPAVTVSGTAPALSWNETDGTADAKRYDLIADDGKLVHRIVNDAGTLSKVWLEIGRSATSAVWSRYIAAVRSRIITLADGATITPDFAAGNVFAVTLAGNRTLANPTNVPSDHQGGSLIIRQDGTGSRTLSFGTAWKFAGGGVPSLSTTANAVDRLFYLVVSPTEIHCALQKDFR